MPTSVSIVLLAYAAILLPVSGIGAAIVGVLGVLFQLAVFYALGTD